MTSNPAITIQINSASALESLLGDSSDELQIELRRSIAADFSEKYIKHLVRGVVGSQDEQSRFNQSIRQGIATHLSEKQIKETLQNEAKNITAEIIDPSHIEKKYSKLVERLDKMEEEINKRCKLFESTVKSQVEAALDKVVLPPLVEEISDEIQTVQFRQKVKAEVRQVLNNASQLYQ